MNKSTYLIRKMDCPGEERMVRMRLEGLEDISRLQFDLSKRKVDIFHKGGAKEITKAIGSLKLGSSLERTEKVSALPITEKESNEKNLLVKVLAINFSLFLVEIIFGIIAFSMGLVADSLDMLADAIVYGLGLYGIGKAMQRKKDIARYSGYMQMGLAFLGMIEVLRRFMGLGETPIFHLMVSISLLALAGNLASLYLLKRAQSKEAHMQASWIFTSNDVLANIGVIVAGILVFLTGSRYPDLVVGILILIIVLKGARKILNLAK